MEMANTLGSFDRVAAEALAVREQGVDHLDLVVLDRKIKCCLSVVANRAWIGAQRKQLLETVHVALHDAFLQRGQTRIISRHVDVDSLLEQILDQ